MYTGGLRYPDLLQRRQALFGLAALCVLWRVLEGAVDVAVVRIVLHNALAHVCHLIFAPGLVIRTFDPHVHTILINHRAWSA
jgi:hypothetical protein